MKLNIFSIPIYIGNIDTNKIKIKNKDFSKTWISKTLSSHNFNNIIEESSWVYLRDTIFNLLKEDFNYNYMLSLHGIWENKYLDNDFQEAHIHEGSHFSFIIYKKLNKSQTVFIRPDKNLFQTFYMEKFPQFPKLFIPECRENQIIIFPSCLEHMVLPNSNAETIAGNLRIEANK